MVRWGAPLLGREQMWAKLQQEIREAAWLAIVVLSLSVLSVATALLLVSLG